MRKTIIAVAALLLACAGASAQTDNTITKKEQKAGWQLLWDGKSLDGWVAVKSSAKPEDGWYIKDGELCARKFEGDSKTVVDIRTEKKYTNFMLTLDVKITPGANGGIKYFIQSGKNSNVGCEFQVLDNDVHPDGKKGICGNRTFGSLYDLIAADPEKAKFTVGGWNKVKVVVQGNHVEHWLNGEKVVEYYRNNQMFNALVKTSKFKDYEGFGNFESGYILLQNHKDEVFYKNIKIREL